MSTIITQKYPIKQEDFNNSESIAKKINSEIKNIIDTINGMNFSIVTKNNFVYSSPSTTSNSASKGITVTNFNLSYANFALISKQIDNIVKGSMVLAIVVTKSQAFNNSADINMKDSAGNDLLKSGDCSLNILSPDATWVFKEYNTADKATLYFSGTPTQGIGIIHIIYLALQ